MEIANRMKALSPEERLAHGIKVQEGWARSKARRKNIEREAGEAVAALRPGATVRDRIILDVLEPNLIAVRLAGAVVARKGLNAKQGGTTAAYNLTVNTDRVVRLLEMFKGGSNEGDLPSLETYLKGKATE